MFISINSSNDLIDQIFQEDRSSQRERAYIGGELGG